MLVLVVTPEAVWSQSSLTISPSTTGFYDRSSQRVKRIYIAPRLLLSMGAEGCEYVLVHSVSPIYLLKLCIYLRPEKNIVRALDAFHQAWVY